MAKSIKKAIACMLTVLMVVCSMPFSAFAVVGEEKVDIRLLFNPVYVSGYFDYTETLAADSLFDFTMLQEAPITYNYKYDEATGGVSGNLVLEAKKTEPICNSVGVDPLAEDTALGVGDYFSVTVVMKDCPAIFASQQFIQYSENIEPAGLYSRTASRRTYNGLAGMSDTYFDSVTQGGLKAVDSNSAAGLYAGLDDGAAGNISKIDPALRVIKSCVTSQTGQTPGVPTTVADPGDATLTNPETGELGYLFENVTVCNTFVFKIVGEGEIGFEMYDPHNVKERAYSGGYLISDGAIPSNDHYTTYATTAPEGTLEQNIAKLGAGRMTFFGGNINTGEVPSSSEPEQPHVHNYSAVVTAPTCTEQGYTTYTCDNADGKCDNVSYVADYVEALGHTPAAAVVENNVDATCTEKGTYDEVVYCSVCHTELSRESKENAALGHDMQVVEGSAMDPTCTETGKEADMACSRCDYTEAGAVIPATGHSYSVVVTAPTCTEQGYTTYTCSVCHDSYVDNYTDALGHDMQVVEGTAKAPTCVADGKEADKACSRCDYTEAGAVIPATGAHTEAAPVRENEVPATCVDDGSYDEVVYCSVCGEELSRVSKTIPCVGAHNYSVPVEGTAQAATCTEAGKEADMKCSACDAVQTGAVIEALGHDMQVVDGTAKAPTCVAEGKEADMACSRCDYTEAGAVIPATGAHTEAAPVRENEVDATCAVDGSYDEVTYCSVCGTEISRVKKTIPATGAHSYTVLVSDKVEATCVEDGKTAEYKCANCDATKGGITIPATGIHTPVSANNAVAPTPAKDGHEADTICDVCKQTLENGAVIPALGVNVTIDDTHKSYGTVDVAWGVNNVKYGSSVTVTATALEDCDFVGYEVAGKLVSKEPTYTYVAYKDITITPVFVPHAEDRITVLFYDKYSNVVANFTDVTVEEFQAAMASAIPQAPTYAGYTFTGWSLTDEQIKALDQSTTIWAYYAQVKEELFTVKTTADSTLTVSRGTEVTPTEYKVTFDTKATVYNENATAWSVDGTIVGYGDTYEFYVGSDITVEPVFAAVEAEATVTMIKNYLIQEGSHKVMFLASMNVPDGYTLVDHGFVYGKNLVDADMTLENVGNTGMGAGAGVVKVTSAGTSPVEQFGISYGIKAMTGKACAKAFLTVIKDGELHTIYSDAVEYAY